MVSNQTLTAKKRIIGLDILRFIAIILVMYEHGIYLLLPIQLVKYFTLPQPSIDGVSIFFVLSGFLIGGILLKIIQKSGFTPKDILNFWIRRWLRTIPNYYFVLIIIILIHFFLIKDTKEINFNFFIFSQNLYSPHPHLFPEAWSLSIEEWFYLTFPIFIFIVYINLKDKYKAVIIAASIFIIIPLILRIVKNYRLESADWDEDFRKIVILRLDSLMYGVIGAYVSIYKEVIWKKLKNIGLIVSFIIIIFLIFHSFLNNQNYLFQHVYHFNLESIAVLFTLPYFSKLNSIKSKKMSYIFTFISLISYSMYLVNLSLVENLIIPNLYKALGWEIGKNLISKIVINLSQFSLFWLLTLFISYYLYKYIETPLIKLRDRLEIV